MLIDSTIKKLEQLPDAKIKEVNNFTDLLLSKMDDKIILKNIEELTSISNSFNFLKHEEDLYGESDLKEKYK